MKQSLLKAILEQIYNLPSNITFVLLHPACYFYARPMALELLKDSTGIYVGSGEPYNSWPDFMRSLEIALQEQTGITVALSDEPKAAAQQLAESVGTLEQPLVLFLDEYDRIAFKERDVFVRALTEKLTPGMRLVLAARELPEQLLAKINAASSRTLPDLPEYLMVDYLHTDTPRKILEVRALGPGQALINGRALSQWDGVLPKCLFYFMIDHAMATRNKIFDTFWPNLDKREATNVFHVTKRKVSEILDYDLTTYSNGFYRISDDIHLYYDVVVFHEAVQQAEVEDDPEVAIELYERAIALYRGPFLSTLDQEWVTDRREELETVYIEALVGLARLHQQQGDQEAALGLLHQAVGLTPQREDLARTLMQLYNQRSQPNEALYVYARLEEELQTSLNLLPSPETTQLATEIKQQVSA